VRCLVGRSIQGTRRMSLTVGERDGTGSATYTMDVGELERHSEVQQSRHGGRRR
jgi:hypothetical protein